LGFDEPQPDEERDHQLLDQVNSLRAQVAELQATIASAKENETLASRKLQSFQQVNRSQNTLMRAELQKCRRRLAHQSEVCLRLKQQSEWCQANSPVLSLPRELQGLPQEEACPDEASELSQHHERWENDVQQLASHIRAELMSGSGTGAILGAGACGQADSEGSRHRIAEIEALSERQAREIEELRRQLGERPQAKEIAELRRQLGERPQATNPSAANQDVATLQKELESKRDESKEQVKKLKQLATAYKQMEQGKKDMQAELERSKKALEAARAEAAARPQAPQRPAVSPALVGRVRSMLTAEKAQLAELRASVQADFHQQIPAILQQVMQQQMPQLQLLIENGGQEWKQKYAIECEKRKKLHNLVQELRGNIRVYCRVRPLNARESGSCISFPSPNEVKIVNEDLGIKKQWEFNEVFQEAATQAHVFKEVRDLVVSMLDGYNVCIFAYGQTGSGKTHSMQGTPSDPGIYKRAFNELFEVAKDRKDVNIDLRASITEIYNEEIRDLLSDDAKKPKLQVKMGKEGNHVPGLTTSAVSCTQDVEELMDKGQRNRSVAATDMNAHSSRSHLLIQILATVAKPDGTQRSSCLTLVDLAGSERLAKSGVTGDRAKEAICINKSLSALGDVINARATKSAHTPFRNSTLTHLLQDSLSGESKTLMLLQLNPCVDYVEETMCSLQFGARVNAVEMKK
jgi:kinesin family protein C2/C3